MRIAKGIKGIRKFMNEKSGNVVWHITTPTQLIGSIAWTHQNIIEMMSENGYTFVGWTGNALCFQ